MQMNSDEISANIWISVLAHCEGDVAASESGIESTISEVLVQLDHGQKDHLNGKNLDDSVVGQLGALVLDRDEGENENDAVHKDSKESLPVASPVIFTPFFSNRVLVKTSIVRLLGIFRIESILVVPIVWNIRAFDKARCNLIILVCDVKYG